jgi:hypothetical protein
MPRPAPDVDVVRFDRQTFLTEVWDYHAGDMVTILAPYGGGKTHLGFQLLEHTMTPKLPAVILVMKARDRTVSAFGKRLQLPVMRDWPPPRVRSWMWDYKPRGWLLWPAETDDPDVDDARHREIFKRAIRQSYRKGKRIIFADETYSLENELNLSRDLNRVWTKGRSMECGLWAGSQRPVSISRWAYQAHHLFLGHDGDVDTQRRLGEIGGGIDAEVVRGIVMRLQTFEFLYINRDERAMCIISAA